jgi:hypothetical protein
MGKHLTMPMIAGNAPFDERSYIDRRPLDASAEIGRVGLRAYKPYHRDRPEHVLGSDAWGECPQWVENGR